MDELEKRAKEIFPDLFAGNEDLVWTKGASWEGIRSLRGGLRRGGSPLLKLCRPILLRWELRRFRGQAGDRAAAARQLDAGLSEADCLNGAYFFTDQAIIINSETTVAVMAVGQLARVYPSENTRSIKLGPLGRLATSERSLVFCFRDGRQDARVYAREGVIQEILAYMRRRYPYVTYG
jgi:hypothetical protein